jgi:hypothetical protein
MNPRLGASSLLYLFIVKNAAVMAASAAAMQKMSHAMQQVLPSKHT